MAIVPLDYAQAPPRRRWRGPVIVAMMIVAAAMVVAPRIERIMRRLPLLSVQRRCANFTLPAGQVAYEEDHEQATRLAGGKLHEPGWTTLSDQAGNILGFYLVPELLNRYYDPESGFTLQPCDHFLFLHARRAKGGQERLVYIRVNNVFAIRAGSDTDLAPGRTQEQQVLEWTVIQPGRLFSPPSKLASASWGDNTVWINMPKPLRIYAGQADPADASHLTFAFTTPQGTSQIDGWLQANDAVTFSVKQAFP